MSVDLEDTSTWPSGIYICRITGCENFGLPVVMQVPHDDPRDALVICGGCANEITNKSVA